MAILTQIIGLGVLFALVYFGVKYVLTSLTEKEKNGE